jgi:hypothetical protein
MSASLATQFDPHRLINQWYSLVRLGFWWRSELDKPNKGKR